MLDYKTVLLSGEGERIMRTDEWLQEIFKLIEESESENRELLLLKWASISSELGYEISFD
jgi:hypothetical protein